jgi:hypothetical protein
MCVYVGYMCMFNQLCNGISMVGEIRNDEAKTTCLSAGHALNPVEKPHTSL